jgi:hypothetical protein
MCINITYHQKNPLQNSTYNLSFEVYMQFFILSDVYFFDTNISYVQVCKFLLRFILRYINLSLKLMQYTWNEQRLSKMWRPRVPKKNQMHNFYFYDYNLWGE